MTVFKWCNWICFGCPFFARIWQVYFNLTFPKKKQKKTPKMALQHYDSDHIPHSTRSRHVAVLYSALLSLLMSENDNGKC